jgi:hypothetical protein
MAKITFNSLYNIYKNCNIEIQQLIIDIINKHINEYITNEEILNFNFENNKENEVNELVEFIEQIYLTKRHWDVIMRYANMSDGFIRYFKKNIDWKTNNILENPNMISEVIIEEFKDNINWANVTRNNNTNLEFLKKYNKYIDYHVLSETVCDHPEIVEEFKDKLDWHTITDSGELTIEFVRKYKKYICWGSFRELDLWATTKFFDEFKYDICWEQLVDYSEKAFTYSYKHNLINRDNYDEPEFLEEDDYI